MRSLSSFTMATALALAASTASRPASAESECAPEPIEVHFLYPAEDTTTGEPTGVPFDAQLVVGFSQETCDGPLPAADALRFELGDSEGLPVAATIAPLPDDDVLTPLTLHGFVITPSEPLTPGAVYVIGASGAETVGAAAIAFVALDQETQHAEPPALTVEVFDVGERFTDLDVSFERPPQAHGVVLLQLTTEGGAPIGRPSLPREGEGPLTHSFPGLPEDAERGCLQALLRAPDGVVIEGEPTCFSVDGGGGCSAGAGRAPGVGALAAAIAALALARRRLIAR